MDKEINISPEKFRGLKISIKRGSETVARTYIYFLKNDLHSEDLGYIEDVFVSSEHRGQGLGREVVNRAVEEARRHGCYKVVLSTHKEGLVAWYESLGFSVRGTELRIDFQ